MLFLDSDYMVKFYILPLPKIIMNFEYIFWDVEGTLYNHKEHGHKHLYCGLKKTIKKIKPKKQGIISNNPMAKFTLDSFNILKYFNPNLIFDPHTEVDKILNNPELKKKYNLTDNYAENFEYLEKQIAKPTPYLFNKAAKIAKADPRKCLMIGDSYEDIVAAQLASFNSVYISGLEEDFCNTKTLGLNPDWTVKVGDIKGLEKIIFKNHHFY